MATYTSAAAASTVQAKTAVQGVISKTGSYLITTALNVTGNIFQMVWVPAGATILDVILYSPQIDSGSGLVLNVGTAGGSGYIASETTVGRAAGTRRGGTFVPSALSATDTVDLTIATQAGTPVQGTVYLTVYYTMDA